MAMRENTGLQIALIIFVMITVVLAVTTYLNFNSAQESARELTEKNKTLTQRDSTILTMGDEVKALREKMGYKRETEGGEKVADIETNFKSDIVGAGYNPETTNYREVVKQLSAKIRDLSQQVVREKERADTAETQLAAARDRDQKNAELYLAQQRKAAEDLAAMTVEYKTRREQFESQGVRIQDDFEKRSLADSKVIADKDKENEALMQRIATMNLRQQNLTEKIETIQRKSGGNTAAKPDGKVTWVSQRGGTVYINLGSEDGLQRGTRFTVYDADTVNIGATDPKASIEVTNIRSASLAEARIIEDTLSNPILSQDVVYSPVWTPGQKTHFALVGFMDIDGNGKSDRRLIRNLIQQNGGVIDAEVHDDGAREGRLSINTRYLVQGAKATDKSSQETLQASSRMIQEAQELGIETISVERLLSDMGWRGSDRTVGAGRDPSGGSFRPAPKEPTEAGAPGSPFQQRTPPGSVRRGSAY